MKSLPGSHKDEECVRNKPLVRFYVYRFYDRKRIIFKIQLIQVYVENVGMGVIATGSFSLSQGQSRGKSPLRCPMASFQLPSLALFHFISPGV